MDRFEVSRKYTKISTVRNPSSLVTPEKLLHTMMMLQRPCPCVTMKTELQLKQQDVKRIISLKNDGHSRSILSRSAKDAIITKQLHLPTKEMVQLSENTNHSYMLQTFRVQNLSWRVFLTLKIEWRRWQVQLYPLQTSCSPSLCRIHIILPLANFRTS